MSWPYKDGTNQTQHPVREGGALTVRGTYCHNAGQGRPLGFTANSQLKTQPLDPNTCLRQGSGDRSVNYGGGWRLKFECADFAVIFDIFDLYKPQIFSASDNLGRSLIFHRKYTLC